MNKQLNNLDDTLWPYGKPLPNSVVLSRGVDERIFQMPYSLLKKQIEAYTKASQTKAVIEMLKFLLDVTRDKPTRKTIMELLNENLKLSSSLGGK